MKKGKTDAHHLHLLYKYYRSLDEIDEQENHCGSTIGHKNPGKKSTNISTSLLNRNQNES